MPYNIADDVWDQAVEEIRACLIPLARHRQTITYSDLARRVRATHVGAGDKAFHEMLGDVSRRAHDLGEPLLSAVVVHKEDGRPGGGFCRMARGLGFEIPDDAVAEDVFWGAQREQLADWWRRR